MNTAPQWALEGDWFDVCNCDIPCPCEFAQPPTNNHCEGVLAWHVREGHFGDVRLDGLNVLGLGSFDGNLWAGAKTAMGFYLDEHADQAQRDALWTIFSGQAGGWPAGFAALVDDLRGTEYAAVHIEVDDDLAGWRAEVPGHVTAAAEALSGPTTPPGARVQLLNPPGSEVGPGQVATWGVSTAATVDAPAFAMSFRWGGRSSKHIPFDWSGPDQ
ncbi:DUF1326 domain-containing protein [Georgenia thermotolerans]|uniref:DUF1326 domain-containing protein n=1 Tax=Georgenia thermotolerans TaxID=527326 RepID=A0A7J5USH7_9MICO|nr:DUF1326 domain-containing protein [Georgenia thermotolerans]KAE8765201.1 DUF1326 domain-containing protein [Georgenia thermotolerans]